VHATESHRDRPDYPEADVPDVAVATLEFAGGARGCLSSTSVLRWKHRTGTGIHLFADGLAIELAELEMTVHAGGDPTVHRAEGSAKERADRCFVDAVRGKPNRIRASYEEVLPTHRLACLVARSAVEGRRVEVAERGAHG
jgi:predicted dehydrogenase